MFDVAVVVHFLEMYFVHLFLYLLLWCFDECISGKNFLYVLVFSRVVKKMVHSRSLFSISTIFRSSSFQVFNPKNILIWNPLEIIDFSRRILSVWYPNVQPILPKCWHFDHLHRYSTKYIYDVVSTHTHTQHVSVFHFQSTISFSPIIIWEWFIYFTEPLVWVCEIELLLYVNSFVSF